MTDGRTIDLAGLPTTVHDVPQHAHFWDLVHRGSWESATLRAIGRLAPGGVYIDVGAWIGPTVIVGARHADWVVAYEPDPVAAVELRTNIRLNGLTNVEVREVGLLDRDGTLALGPGMLGELGLSVSSLMYGPREHIVPVKDGRTEADTPLFAGCSLLKIDIEGAEFRLVKRLAPYLRARRPALLLSIHSVHWEPRDYRRLPGAVVRVYLRSRIAIERLQLFWRLRHYKHWYVEYRGAWVPFSRQTWRDMILRPGESELLLTNQPYDAAG